MAEGNSDSPKPETFTYHRFLDEAGDTTFYGKGHIPIVGNEGVSNAFILGMLNIKEPLEEVRKKTRALQEEIAADEWFAAVPSIIKKKAKSGYFLHAKDDLPEVRKMVFELIKSIDCSFEAIVARKIYSLYEKKHNGNESEFYADLLSHLLENKLSKYEKLVLSISKRSKCTTHKTFKRDSVPLYTGQQKIILKMRITVTWYLMFKPLRMSLY